MEKAINLSDVRVRGVFWGPRIDMIRKNVLKYQWDILNDNVPGAESHCIRNFRIATGLEEGEYVGMVFQDSDLAKWIEAAAYALEIERDPELEALVDGAVELIEKAQQIDGYLNTYYTVKEPGRRWTNFRDGHELYCAGHMMEAAVAYYEATGKRRLLDVMLHMVRYIDSIIGAEEGKLHAYPGHQEIELALTRMYGVTGDVTMLKLASYFLNARGGDYFEREERDVASFVNLAYDRRYAQNHMPVLEQDHFVGHAVRALYMATGMAEFAAQTSDERFAEACERLFDNMAARRMYLTGGVGSSSHQESFTFDYDLPGDRAYAETCASVALCFFARAMLKLSPDGKYADAMERALYNTCLAGMALDGRHFFYVNPLEVVPEASELRKDTQHVLSERPSWFKCACCPPNLMRLVLSLGKYAFGGAGDTAFVHLYMSGEAKIPLDGQEASFSVETEYPVMGAVRIRPEGGRYILALRIPAWSAADYTICVNGSPAQAAYRTGYAYLNRTWRTGDEVMLTLSVAPRRTYANPLLRAANGCIAVERGPLVYCLEEADNGKHLNALILPEEAPLFEEARPKLLDGIVRILADGYAENCDPHRPLYSPKKSGRASHRLIFIPYHVWANRGPNEMRVWVRAQ